jgi:hypothetical protein
MGLCQSNQKVFIKDFSHCKSPVQAARLAHRIKGYDEEIGEFTYHGLYFYLQPSGAYACCELYPPNSSS